jgi:hypothetical protein
VLDTHYPHRSFTLEKHLKIIKKKKKEKKEEEDRSNKLDTKRIRKTLSRV